MKLVFEPHAKRIVRQRKTPLSPPLNWPFKTWNGVQVPKTPQPRRRRVSAEWEEAPF